MTFDTHAYLRSWEGIGADGRRFDDFHAFILTAKPCWAKSVRATYQGQEYTPNKRAREEQKRLAEGRSQ